MSLLLVAIITIFPILSSVAARDRQTSSPVRDEKSPFRPKIESNINAANNRIQLPPPPPPPPPPPTGHFSIDSSVPEPLKETSPNPTLSPSDSYNPIHYNFPIRSVLDTTENTNNYIPNDSKNKIDQNQFSTDIISPPTFTSSRRQSRRRHHRLQSTEYASARQDAIIRYSSTLTGHLQLKGSSTLVGFIIGSFLGKSIVGHAKPLCILFAILFLFSTFFRNDYGELSKALGLAFIFMFQRVQHVRQQYPTKPYIMNALGITTRNRIPFPPNPVMDNEIEENPWSYKPLSRNDPEFNMIQSIIAVAIIGSFCGGNIPLLPTWIGSALGALTLSFLCTSRSSRGDVTRIMGMRVVAFCKEALDINQELKISNKSGVVAGKIFDKVMILDRKHRIKDRLIQVLNWIYEKVASTVSQVQKDASQTRE